MQTNRLVRIILGLAVICLFSLHAMGAISITLIKTMENFAYDTRLLNTMPNTIDNRIVILDIDEKSITEVGHWPWSRNVLAIMIDNLFDHYQAKAVIFDIAFPEKDNSSGLTSLDKLAEGPLRNNTEFREQLEILRPSLEYDRLFAESLKNRAVIMGYVFHNDPNANIGMLPAYISTWNEKLKAAYAIPSAAGYSGNHELLQANALTGGFFNNDIVDNDGVFRKTNLIQEYKGYLFESLELAAARVIFKSPAPTLILGEDSSGEYKAVEYVEVGDYQIPIDASTGIMVPYRGGLGSFPYRSASDIINKRTAIDDIKDKIIYIGTTAPGLLDLRSTPVAETYPGVEVHANILSGILDKNIKHKPEYAKGFETFYIVLIGLLMIWLTSLLSPIWVFLASLAILITTVVLNLIVWNSGYILNLAEPLLLIITLFTLQMSYGFFVESKNKRAISKIFGQYIPPELVDEMSEDPKDLSLEGVSREMTVLFSDVRNFTHISEGLNPKELTHLMNDFLTPMTRVIHKHRGTIDKYMGDAIMAFWGAPLKDPYHAKNALLAGLEMLEVLKQQQEEFKRKGYPPINIGIGINTGVMNVGNMGSEFRMAYTVLGDAVNLGSRLEGLTKTYDAAIIVGEATKEAVPEFDYLELDRVKVKGKDEPITIYEPIGYGIELDKEKRKEIRLFNNALKIYREQNWDAAERDIFTLSRLHPTVQLYKIYLDRIMHYRKSPPGENWDGVFVHTSK